MADTFRNRLIKAMEIRGMRQVDLAEKSVLPKAQISQYKSGKYEPMQDALYKLAKALSVNVAWLMGHDVPMEVDRQQLEKEVEICDLINKCYGKEAYAVVKMYLDMNENGRKLAFDLINNLHSNPQNVAKEKKKEAM